MVRIFKGSCLAKRILAVVSQQGLVLQADFGGGIAAGFGTSRHGGGCIAIRFLRDAGGRRVRAGLGAGLSISPLDFRCEESGSVTAR